MSDMGGYTYDPNITEIDIDTLKRDKLGNPTGYGSIYVSAAAEVNRRPFKALVPVYTTVKPIEEKQQETYISYAMGQKVKHTVTHLTPMPATFYNPIDPSQKIQTAIPLSRIIELYHDGEPFDLLDSVEQIQGFMLLDAYLNEIKEHVQANAPGFADYALKCLKFRKVFYRGFVRACWSFSPRGEAWNNYKKSVDSRLLRALLGLEQKEERPDGIARLAEPPYTEEWVNAQIARAEKEKRGPGTGPQMDLVEEYLKKDDGAIKSTDPFEREALRALPELSEASSTDLNHLLKGY